MWSSRTRLDQLKSIGGLKARGAVAVLAVGSVVLLGGCSQSAAEEPGPIIDSTITPVEGLDESAEVVRGEVYELLHDGVSRSGPYGMDLASGFYDYNYIDSYNDQYFVYLARNLDNEICVIASEKGRSGGIAACVPREQFYETGVSGGFHFGGDENNRLAVIALSDQQQRSGVVPEGVWPQGVGDATDFTFKGMKEYLWVGAPAAAQQE